MVRKAGSRRATPPPSTGPVQKIDQSLTAKKGESVSFEVLCRPRSEANVQEMTDRLSLEHVERYSPDQQTLFEVGRTLQRLGFRVHAEAGGTSVSAEGPHELFESAFRTAVRKRGRTLKLGERRYSFAFFDTKEGAPAPSLRDVPGALDVAIQRPPILFESPLPPPPAYHHLRVPGDVAMLTRASATQRRRTGGGDRATGAGVRVAMLDTGFYHHPYLVAHGYRLTSVLAADATGPATQDDHGHGTGECANIFACAPDARVFGVKMGANAVLSFDRAMLLRPKVVSCSWGFHLPGVTTLPTALLTLRLRILSVVASGVTVVFSAGNGHVSFPGMMPEVLSVGGVFADPDGALSASNYASSFMSLIYPGRRVPDLCGLVGLQPRAAYILLPIPAGCVIDNDLGGTPFPAGDATAKNDGWGVFSGTSAAAPQLAGICALLLQKRPGLSPDQVKAALRGTARDVTAGISAMGEPAGPGDDAATGAGLVDAFAAWSAI